MITLKQMGTIRILKEHLIALKKERESLATKIKLADTEILMLREALAGIKNKIESDSHID